MSLRYGARMRPGTMVSTWLNGLVSGTVSLGAAYFAGGYVSGPVATVDKFAFTDDSRSTLGTGLSAARTTLAGAANSGTAAYFAGGESVSTVDKFAFSDDSRSTLGTGLSAATYGLAGAADSVSL